MGPITYTIIAETSSVRLRALSTGIGRAAYYGELHRSCRDDLLTFSVRDSDDLLCVSPVEDDSGPNADHQWHRSS